MARNFVAASNQYITLVVSTASQVHGLSAGAVSAWFKSTNAGTTRLVIYNEGKVGAPGLSNLFISLNDGAAGRIRGYRRDDSSNQVSITYDGSYNDGNWHCVVFSWSALNSHELFVDGVSRGTDTTNNISGGKTVDRHCIGRRICGGTTEGYFDGAIADIALYSTALDVTAADDLYDKTKYPANVVAVSNLRSWWTLAGGSMPVTDRFDIRHLDDAVTVTGATVVDGPDATLPTGTVASPDLGTAAIFDNFTNTTLVSMGGVAGDSDRLLRELGNVVHTPSDTGKEYKMYYSGSPDPYTGSNVGIHMAYSSDMATWTEQGAVITSATLPSEDPYVVYNGGTYHLWCENKTGGTNANGIAHFTSPDGIAWTLENATAMDAGAGGEWDDEDVSSPTVWTEASTWYMLYEGRGNPALTDGQVGLATAASPNGPWTKSVSNPVLAVGAGGTWDDVYVVPDDIFKVSSTYWMLYHARDGSNERIGLASSADLTTWTKSSLNPVTRPGTWGAGGIQRLGISKGYAVDASGNIGQIQFLGADGTDTEWPPAPTSPPTNAPSGLTATASASDTIDLAWTDNSSDETGFRIQRSLDGAAWSTLDTVAADAESYSDTTCSPNTRYYYQVCAYNDAGDSAYSDPANAKTPPDAATLAYKFLIIDSGQIKQADGRYLALVDGVPEPDAVAGVAWLYVDQADGDLKIKFGDGFIRTLGADS